MKRGESGRIASSSKKSETSSLNENVIGTPPLSEVRNKKEKKEESKRSDKKFLVDSDDPYALPLDDEDDSIASCDKDGSIEGSSNRKGGKKPKKKTVKQGKTFELNVSCGLPPVHSDDSKDLIESSSPAKRRPSKDQFLEEEQTVRPKKRIEREDVDDDDSQKEGVTDDEDQEDGSLIVLEEDARVGCEYSTRLTKFGSGLSRKKKTENLNYFLDVSDNDDNDNNISGRHKKRKCTLQLDDSMSLLECAELRDRTELFDDLKFSLDGIKHNGSVRIKSAVHLLDRVYSDTRSVGLLFRSEDLFDTLFGALNPINGSESTGEICAELALLGSLLLMLCEDEVNCSHITVPALKVLANDIATLKGPTVTERRNSLTVESSVRKTTSDGSIPMGSPAAKTRAKSAFFSCLKSTQQQQHDELEEPSDDTETSKPKKASSLLGSAYSSVSSHKESNEESEALNKVQRIICTSAPFAGFNKDIVCCGTVALECALYYCRDKSIPNARDECRATGVLAIVLSVLEKQLCSSGNNAALSYLSMTEDKRHLLNSLLEFIEQATYLNQENQKMVTSGPCWHNIIALLLKTTESWSAASPPNLTHFLLQLVQVLINLANDNASSCDEFISSDALPSLALVLETSMYSVDDEIQSLRNMCLTLFINLAELDDRIPSILINDCKLSCGQTFLPFLADTFHHVHLQSSQTSSDLALLPTSDSINPDDAEESRTERNVFASYCAILLALLVEGDADHKSIVINAGVSMQDLGTLISEFVAFQASTGLLSRHSCDSFERVLKALADHPNAEKN